MTDAEKINDLEQQNIQLKTFISLLDQSSSLFHCLEDHYLTKERFPDLIYLLQNQLLYYVMQSSQDEVVQLLLGTNDFTVITTAFDCFDLYISNFSPSAICQITCRDTVIDLLQRAISNDECLSQPCSTLNSPNSDLYWAAYKLIENKWDIDFSVIAKSEALCSAFSNLCIKTEKDAQILIESYQIVNSQPKKRL